MSYLQPCIWEAGGWQVGQLDQREPVSRKQTKHTKNKRKKNQETRNSGVNLHQKINYSLLQREILALA